MSFDWQNAVVLAVVVAASGYIARRIWQSIALRKAAACGGCPTCSASKQAEPVSVIGVEQLLRSTDTLQSPRNGEPVTTAGRQPMK